MHAPGEWCPLASTLCLLCPSCRQVLELSHSYTQTKFEMHIPSNLETEGEYLRPSKIYNVYQAHLLHTQCWFVIHMQCLLCCWVVTYMHLSSPVNVNSKLQHN